jgi:hypothetical protein
MKHLILSVTLFFGVNSFAGLRSGLYTSLTTHCAVAIESSQNEAMLYLQIVSTDPNKGCTYSNQLIEAKLYKQNTYRSYPGMFEGFEIEVINSSSFTDGRYLYSWAGSTQICPTNH